MESKKSTVLVNQEATLYISLPTSNQSVLLWLLFYFEDQNKWGDLLLEKSLKKKTYTALQNVKKNNVRIRERSERSIGRRCIRTVWNVIGWEKTFFVYEQVHRKAWLDGSVTLRVWNGSHSEMEVCDVKCALTWSYLPTVCVKRQSEWGGNNMQAGCNNKSNVLQDTVNALERNCLTTRSSRWWDCCGLF